MIAHGFPPEGNAGAYRPLRFVRHLSAYGWRACVVAADAYHYERYDPGLLPLVPEGTTVVRVRGRDIWQEIQARRGRRVREQLGQTSPEVVARTHAVHSTPFRSRLRELVRQAEAWWYRPDEAMSWIRPAVSAVVKLCQQERPRVLWATA
jgi:hypothetical protein